MFINSNATPKEKDKQWNRMFNISAGLSTLTMVLSLVSQNYHDDVRAELKNDPEGLCDRYYLAHSDQIRDSTGEKVTREAYDEDCTTRIRNMPEDSPQAERFSQISIAWAGIAGLGLYGWHRNRKRHPELSKPSPNNHEPQ